jgi:hypothetical protein
MSNTSIGRGKKGSKFWIQTLLNLDKGKIISSEIQRLDSSIGDITWLSPLKKDLYRELKSNDILEKVSDDLQRLSIVPLFWPDQGPWWDGVGIVNESKTIILVEAKAHVEETITKCRAKDPDSIVLIKQSLRDAHEIIISDYAYGTGDSHNYDEEIWFNKYYQLGNRLAFMAHLKKQGFNVKLVLLNILDDPTYIATSKDKWEQHYNEVFQSMLGICNCPKDVAIVYYDAG